MGKKKQAKKAAKALALADRDATHGLARVRARAPVKLAGFLAEAADQPQLIAASLGTIGVGLLSRRRDLVRGGSRMLIAHLVATGVKSVLKAQIDRTRPGTAIEQGEATLERGHGTDDHAKNSFPSGHTAGAVAVARAAARDIDGVAAPAAVSAGAVAALQPPTGSHYISDVLAGALVGWASEAIVSLVFDRVEPVLEQAIDARIGHHEPVA